MELLEVLNKAEKITTVCFSYDRMYSELFRGILHLVKSSREVGLDNVDSQTLLALCERNLETYKQITAQLEELT